MCRYEGRIDFILKINDEKGTTTIYKWPFIQYSQLKTNQWTWNFNFKVLYINLGKLHQSLLKSYAG